MARRPYGSLLLVFSLILLVTFSSFTEAYKSINVKPAACKPKCNYRCSGTQHKSACQFFCLKCCARCMCVPPGTYGNKQACPCYNSWKTKEGRPKCP